MNKRIEKIVRKMVRHELNEMFEDGEAKEILTENFGGFASLPAIGGVHGLRSQKQENWSWNQDSMRNIDSQTRSQMGFEPSKRQKEAEVVREEISFVNEEAGDSVSMWIEDGNLVAEVSTEKGTQTLKLSDVQTKKVIQTMIEEMSFE